MKTLQEFVNEAETIDWDARSAEQQAKRKVIRKLAGKGKTQHSGRGYWMHDVEPGKDINDVSAKLKEKGIHHNVHQNSDGTHWISSPA